MSVVLRNSVWIFLFDGHHSPPKRADERWQVQTRSNRHDQCSWDQTFMEIAMQFPRKVMQKMSPLLVLRILLKIALRVLALDTDIHRLKGFLYPRQVR